MELLLELLNILLKFLLNKIVQNISWNDFLELFNPDSHFVDDLLARFDLMRTYAFGGPYEAARRKRRMRQYQRARMEAIRRQARAQIRAYDRRKTYPLPEKIKELKNEKCFWFFRFLRLNRMARNE